MCDKTVGAIWKQQHQQNQTRNVKQMREWHDDVFAGVLENVEHRQPSIKLNK